MSEELKPCPVPWCGETVQISFIVSHWSGNACAECLSCKARGPWCETKDAAIAAWNTRPVTSHPGEDAVEREKAFDLETRLWAIIDADGLAITPSDICVAVAGLARAARNRDMWKAQCERQAAALSHDPQKEALLTAIDAWMADPSPATEQGIMDAREALSSTLSGGLDRG